MKIYINKASENWVVDRFRDEWYKYNQETYANNYLLSNIVWIISPWTFPYINFQFIKNKKIVYSVYHIEEETKIKTYEHIKKIDKFINCYHTISKQTKEEISKLTNKKVYYIPFWIDPNIWFNIEDKEKLFKKYNLDKNKYFVGSFQRDSLKNKPNLPKLIKGPDIFLNNIVELKKIKDNLEIILTGRKRGYLINELQKYNIKFKYFEMVNQIELNELYNCLDLYIISSRIEGGPQAIAECGLTKTPLVSTDVGMASEFLNPKSIYQPGKFLIAKADTDYLAQKVKKLTIPEGFYEFEEMFDSL